VEFFNEFGSNDSYSYGGGFPTRLVYAKDKLRSFNGSNQMIGIVQTALDPLFFEDKGKSIEAAIDYLNRYLRADGFEALTSRGATRVCKLGDQLVEIETAGVAADALSQEFIDEQIEKCRRKLAEEDYDGAITNARSLVEAVLVDIEGTLTGSSAATDGDLLKQFKRVQKLLNLEPSREDISNSLRQVLTGLTSIVSGIAPLRNRMSDAHARSYKPGRHHAKLVINASQTLVDFLFETLEFQVRQGTIKINGPSS
jgi:hypothetical protein